MEGMGERGREPAPSLAVECITNEAQFEEARVAWDALAHVSPGAHLYQSYEWIRAWMSHGHDSSPRLLVAYRGDRMTAAMPLALHHGGLGPLGLRTLRVAADSCDYCDALSDPAFPEDVRSLWSTVLHHRDWHLLDLRYLRPDSLLAALSAGAPRGFLASRQPMEIAPYLDLTIDWRRSVAKGQRSDWERRRRRLQEQGNLTLDRAESPAEVDRMLEQLAGFHVARWRARGETSVFTLGHYRRQMRAVCHGMLRRGHLYLFRVALNGDPVSIGMHFLIHRRMLPYVYGFSEEYARFCPVHLMVMGVVEYARERDLADVYDFGRGSEEYKLRWTQHSVPLGRVLMARRSPIALGGYGWAVWGQPFVWRHYRLNTLFREFQRRRQLRHDLPVTD